MSEFIIPGSVPSALNLRDSHWRVRHERVKRQREQARLLARLNAHEDAEAMRQRGGTVTLVRIAPRKLDSGDNLAGSMKAYRDGIASALGINDGDERVAWRYEQERCKSGAQAVRVVVEAARP